MTLLALCAVGIFLAMQFMARQQRALQKAILAAKQLGQYSLEEKLGAGGMGTVYKARHAMLHRPTAVKFLSPDQTREDSIARFEREVQLTSQLNHPNTIAIYDYGRTPEGLFYYAMEYLDGINLEDLVRTHGPLPDGRVVWILQQLCGSLVEAHGIGLIHRDIKPSNIVLNERGGIFDFVKLLDFGLVKALDGKKQTALTASGALTGTPLYLSPEAIGNSNSVDARSDLYAVGAVGYFLVTGTSVFEGANVIEIIQHHLQTPPDPPSRRVGFQISEDLERTLLRCLAKTPADRPQSANELAAEISCCSVTSAWTQADAERWWRTFRPQVAPAVGPSAMDATLPPRSDPTARTLK